MMISLRRAEQKDLPRIQALFAEMMRAIDPASSGEGYAPEDVAYYFSGGDDWICLAEEAGEAVAFLAMETHREDVNYIYLDDLSVTVALRGRGIGTMLLNEAEKFARSMGISLIVLHVKITNPRAKALYERMGFAVLDDDGDRYRMLKTMA